MIRHAVLVISALMLTLFPAAGQSGDKFSLEDIYKNGRFTARGIDNLRSSADGIHYTLLERENGNYSVNEYRYSDGVKTGTLFSSRGIPGLDGRRIYGYEISPSGDKILLETEHEPVFRRSFLARYYVFDRDKGTSEILDTSKVQQPAFSPDGTKVAYSKDNDIYYKDLASGNIVRVTRDGRHGHVINGTADWVYEEEFAVVRMFGWSPSGGHIAYVRFDESAVPVYGMDIYGESLYPVRQTFKYPKAGENNSCVSLHIYHLADSSATEIGMDSRGDFYIPRIKWVPGADRLAYFVMNRAQNHLEVFSTDPNGDNTELLFEDTDKAYINLDDNTVFLNDGSVVFVSERDGRAHLYIRDKKGSVTQLTRGQWQVTDFYGIDEKKGLAYIQSTIHGPENRTVSCVDIRKKSARRGSVYHLSAEKGTNSAVFSKGFKYYINTLKSTDTPPLYTLNDPRDGHVIKTLRENTSLAALADSLALPRKEFSTLKMDGGYDLKMWTMKPADFDPAKKYPVLMYVYGGPGSQQVLNSWYNSMDLWFAYLTTKGYIVTCVDNRGTGGRGAGFEKQIYRRMGQLETEDQIEAARKISTLPYVDPSRIGIFGWSFGGYMSSLCATRGGGIFRAAIAVAPVTSWRFYDSIYTERYLSTPQDNSAGYDDNSPLTYAGDLSGRFLLVHGTADDNVHYQNAMRFSSLLVSHNRPFRQMTYADKNHSINGGMTSLHLFTMMTDFILENL